MSRKSGKSCKKKKTCGCPCVSYLEVKRVIGVRHEPVLVGALQLETVRDASAGRAVLAVAVEVGQAVDVAQFSEVFVCAVHSTCAQVLHHTCYYIIKMVKNYVQTLHSVPLYIVKNLHQSK